MIFGYLTLITALIISVSSAIYSILGLTAIFSAAYWPIVILGGSLEFGKIVTTLWLHKYWHKAETRYKIYLSFAVGALMLMTSMGVFGFLSKAHLDQNVPSGDIQAQVQIFDDKIKTQRDNIESARKALAQMDAAVDQTMGRSTDEKGADKAASLRRSQGKERALLQNDITKAQKEIVSLQEQRAPLASQARKVEAEVGPIKYIAALIYGDTADATVLEKAVRWVIILIVCVFDPLALTLLLAATKTFEWEREIPEKENDIDEESNIFWTSVVDHLEPIVDQPTHIPVEEYYRAMGLFDQQETQADNDSIDTINKQFREAFDENYNNQLDLTEWQQESKTISDPHTAGWMFPMPVLNVNITSDDTDIEPYGTDIEKHIMRVWKNENPDSTYKEQLEKFRNREISELPWKHSSHIEKLNLSDRDLINLKELEPQADNMPAIGEVRGFGIEFPKEANKGDMFLRVDSLPSQLYKYNGIQWIKVNKNLSDSYIYDDAYINHLIEKIGSGEYDPDLLSDVERERIAEKLKNSNDLG